MMKRFYSSIKEKIYEHTVNLPKTTFPMKANAVKNERNFRHHCTDYLYNWQLKNNTGNLFILHDGPPYANGNLHIGHALNKILKDFILRYKILKGYKVHYKPGWDTHGLPIELKALSTVKNKKDLSPQQIREVAKDLALKTVELQKESFKEWAILGDWEHPYLTLDPRYEANQLEIFSKMFEKGLIYRKLRPVYYSPSTRTSLAEAEIEYNENHQSRSIYLKFALDKHDFPQVECKNLYSLIWTTTPWTLPANRALAINKEIEYKILFDPENNGYLIAENRISEIHDIFEIKNSISISTDSLLGKSYSNPLNKYSGKIINGSFVTSDSGTGIVHIAPAHGFDDYEVCKQFGIEPFCPINEHGHFTNEVEDFLVGKDIFTEGTEIIIQKLKEKSMLMKEHLYRHKYPYDWRSKKPVIIRSTKQWFANVDEIKKDCLESLIDVKIIPHTGRNRLESYISQRNEWCISRQRSWGVPIPVYYSKEDNEPFITNETLKHFSNLVSKHGTDIWWSWEIKDLLPESLSHLAPKLEKGTDTMDVWFDSGASWSMTTFPADIYLEGSDQHRGWFQSSLLTSISATGKAPFKTLISHGFVMDEKGRKMSKSIGNVINPTYITSLGKDPSTKKVNFGYGVDVMRLWVSSTDYTKDVLVGDNLLKAVAENQRKIRNTARFMLANLNNFNQAEFVSYDHMNPVDQFILHRLYHFVSNTEAFFENFEFSRVYHSLQNFISNDLSSFYFDVAKDILYNNSTRSHARSSAQSALFTIFDSYMKVISPITPHLAEELFTHARHLYPENHNQKSVFELGWPKLKQRYENIELAKDFEGLLEIRSLVNSALEKSRQQKIIGSSIQANVNFSCYKPEYDLMQKYKLYLNQLYMVSSFDFSLAEEGEVEVKVTKSEKTPCQRCFIPSTEKLCSRCIEAIDNYNKLK